MTDQTRGPARWLLFIPVARSGAAAAARRPIGDNWQKSDVRHTRVSGDEGTTGGEAESGVEVVA